jgi:hypothetical protein
MILLLRTWTLEPFDGHIYGCRDDAVRRAKQLTIEKFSRGRPVRVIEHQIYEERTIHAEVWNSLDCKLLWPTDPDWKAKPEKADITHFLPNTRPPIKPAEPTKRNTSRHSRRKPAPST